MDLISCTVGDVSDRRNRRTTLAFAGSILAMSAGAEQLTVSDGGGEEVLATRFVAAIFVGPTADGAPARRPGAPPRLEGCSVEWKLTDPVPTRQG